MSLWVRFGVNSRSFGFHFAFIAMAFGDFSVTLDVDIDVDVHGWRLGNGLKTENGEKVIVLQ